MILAPFPDCWILFIFRGQKLNVGHFVFIETIGNYVYIICNYVVFFGVFYGSIGRHRMSQEIYFVSHCKQSKYYMIGNG